MLSACAGLPENIERQVMIESAKIATEMSDQVAFRRTLEKDKNGNEILLWYRSVDGMYERYSREPNSGFWRRFGVGVLRLLPIEWLL